MPAVRVPMAGRPGAADGDVAAGVAAGWASAADAPSSEQATRARRGRDMGTEQEGTGWSAGYVAT